MPPAAELLHTVCPCGCRAPVLVAAARSAAGVTCPATRRRYALPAGKPVRARFGRKQWDACRDARLLRQAVALSGVEPTARKKRLAALSVADVCLDWCRSPAFLAAKRAAAEIAETGTTAADCLALSEQLAPAAFTWERLDGWRLVGLRLLQADPDLDYGPVESADPLRAADALKEVLPNPFRAVPFDPAWRTSSVAGLTAAIHAHRAFADLPVLADALEDAGCQDWPTLAHLRGPGPHARGCWALDWAAGRG